VIFALWHNRLALTIALSRYPKFQNDRRTIAALVSASKDGALLTRALQYAGIEGVRGSSSRRGGQALLELARCMRRGLNVAITPDGPRGPKYRVREGIISLAQVSSAEIVPVGAKIYSRYTFKSWDAFQLPLPFSRIDLYFGPTISVPPEASDDQRIALAQEVADALKAINPD